MFKGLKFIHLVYKGFKSINRLSFILSVYPLKKIILQKSFCALGVRYNQCELIEVEGDFKSTVLR